MPAKYASLYTKKAPPEALNYHTIRNTGVKRTSETLRRAIFFPNSLAHDSQSTTAYRLPSICHTDARHPLLQRLHVSMG